jgi:CheY-like chemotaxis protein
MAFMGQKKYTLSLFREVESSVGPAAVKWWPQRLGRLSGLGRGSRRAPWCGHSGRAETGEAALSIIESGQTVDVLFTDIRLPGELDGWRLAAMAREAKPGLPVIFVTGYTVNREAAVPDSVFLKKPYRPSAITETICRYLCRRISRGTA